MLHLAVIEIIRLTPSLRRGRGQVGNLVLKAPNCGETRVFTVHAAPHPALAASEKGEPEAVRPRRRLGVKRLKCNRARLVWKVSISTARSIVNGGKIPPDTIHRKRNGDSRAETVPFTRSLDEQPVVKKEPRPSGSGKGCRNFARKPPPDGRGSMRSLRFSTGCSLPLKTNIHDS